MQKRRLISIAAVLLISTLPASAGQKDRKWLVLYDFEDSTQGWENEAARPVEPILSSRRPHHGTNSLCFDFDFGPGRDSFSARVKMGKPRDFTRWESFEGLAAWVRVDKGKNIQAQMFVRSGPTWMWTPGPMFKGQARRWFRVFIPRDAIHDASQVQDFGIYVYPGVRKGTIRICIDHVVAVGVPAKKAMPEED